MGSGWKETGLEAHQLRCRTWLEAPIHSFSHLKRWEFGLPELSPHSNPNPRPFCRFPHQPSHQTGGNALYIFCSPEKLLNVSTLYGYRLHRGNTLHGFILTQVALQWAGTAFEPVITHDPAHRSR